MKLSPDIGLTSIDYPNKYSFIVYTVGCRYCCPTCHSKKLSALLPEAISGEEAIARIKNYKNLDWISGLNICGGEPTIQPDLAEFLRRVKKELKLPVKLDTNGSNPSVLEDLFDEKLVDYVALDIKGPPSLYRRIIGIEKENIIEEPKKFDFRDNLEKAMGIVQNAPDFEFRTTLVPVYEGNTPRWMSPEEIAEMSDYVNGFVFTDPSKLKWYVQKFVSRSKEDGAMIDERFTKENLPREYHETPVNVLEYARNILRKRFPRAEIR